MLILALPPTSFMVSGYITVSSFKIQFTYVNLSTLKISGSSAFQTLMCTGITSYYESVSPNSIGLWWRPQSDKFPGDTHAAGPWTTL